MTRGDGVQIKANVGLTVGGVAVGIIGLHLAPPAVVPAELEFRVQRENKAGQDGTGNEKKSFVNRLENGNRF